MTLRSLRVTVLSLMCLLGGGSLLNAQELSFSGYADGYFGYSTDSIARANGIEQYQTVGVRHRQFGLNVARIAGSYTSENVRGNVALMWGDIPTFNWQGNIQEANVGIRLFDKVWFNIGYFGTHIGTEVLLPRDNITSLLSLGTQHEPFFHSGACLDYDGEKLFVKVMVNNGYYSFWSQKPNLSAGLLLTYAINDNMNIGFSNQSGREYIRNDQSEPLGLRIYNNLWYSYSGERFDILVGADFGTQQYGGLGDTSVYAGGVRDSSSGTVFSAMGAFRFNINDKFAVYIKGEIFNDQDAILTGAVLTQAEYDQAMNPQANYVTNYEEVGRGLQAMAITAGFQYSPTDFSYLRLETQYMNAMGGQTPFFTYDNEATSSRIFFGINAGITFDTGNLLR